MDINSTKNGEENKELKEEQIKPQVQSSTPQSPALIKKIHLPAVHFPNIKEKLAEYKRVLKVTKKPDSEEFKTIVKASGLGIVVIGMVGFIIAIIVQLIKMLK
jgi:protein transport protein SEC61 subunit gamma-like protein